jgi:hypothetical protein
MFAGYIGSFGVHIQIGLSVPISFNSHVLSSDDNIVSLNNAPGS